jgi:hypothetical protein
MNNDENSILSLTSEEAKSFFPDGKRYLTIMLPPYFEFSALLKSLDNYYNNECKNNETNLGGAAKHNDVNYEFITNKDGHYAWRKITMIHPFLYVCLVNLLTENWEKLQKRFEKFNSGVENKIINTGIPPKEAKNEKEKYPKTTILNWWDRVEQEAIKLSLEYSYLVNVDIENCYGSLYTHSVVWAFYGKECAKKNKSNKKLPGNKIDRLLMNISYGQTNGIPQGSV